MARIILADPRKWSPKRYPTRSERTIGYRVSENTSRLEVVLVCRRRLRLGDGTAEPGDGDLLRGLDGLLTGTWRLRPDTLAELVEAARAGEGHPERAFVRDLAAKTEARLQKGLARVRPAPAGGTLAARGKGSASA